MGKSTINGHYTTSTSLHGEKTEDWTRLKDAPGKVKGDRAAALAAVRQSPEAVYSCLFMIYWDFIVI